MLEDGLRSLLAVACSELSGGEGVCGDRDGEEGGESGRGWRMKERKDW